MRVTEQNFEEILKDLKAGNIINEELNLNNQKLNFQKVEELVNALKANKTKLIALNKLNLEQNEIDDAGASALAASLGELKFLREVSLAGNSISTEALAQVNAALEANNTRRQILASTLQGIMSALQQGHTEYNAYQESLQSQGLLDFPEGEANFEVLQLLSIETEDARTENERKLKAEAYIKQLFAYRGNRELAKKVLRGAIAIDPYLLLDLDVIAEFKCTLTRSIMSEPMLLIASGKTYEKDFIEQWIRIHSTDPNTGVQLTKKELANNDIVKSMISDFYEKHIYAKETSLFYIPLSRRERLKELVINGDLEGVKRLLDESIQWLFVDLDYRDVMDCEVTTESELAATQNRLKYALLKEEQKFSREENEEYKQAAEDVDSYMDHRENDLLRMVSEQGSEELLRFVLSHYGRFYRLRFVHNKESARLNEAMHVIAGRFGRDVAKEAGEFLGYVSGVDQCDTSASYEVLLKEALAKQDVDLASIWSAILEADREDERQKLEAEKKAEERLEAERQKLEEAARQELAEKAEREKVAREKAASEKAASEKAEREKVAREKAASEKAEREKVAREKAASEKAASEKAEREKVAREKAASEKAEREKVAREKAASEKAEREKAASEKAAREGEAAARSEAKKSSKYYRDQICRPYTSMPRSFIRKIRDGCETSGELGDAAKKFKKMVAQGEFHDEEAEAERILTSKEEGGFKFSAQVAKKVMGHRNYRNLYRK